MSFFRNIRSSITRGRSSSRDTTPVQTCSRPSSVVSHAASSISEKRRSSVDSHTDSMLNRGETFILGSDQEEKSHSNSSTLEKKSKKSKVLSKFNTFTKRKKTPQLDSNASEHHPSDNATNTYYKWNTDGSTANIDYDAQSDPFNFLYEKPTNLKLLKNGGTESSESHHGFFDSSTYRKGKASTQLKAQLEHLKTQNTDLCEEDQETAAADKYKTVTLNSFRKSFREKYLQQQKDAAYNPSWFVEVDAPEKTGNAEDFNDFKDNRPDYLVFKNENYRPGSRSPVRERNTTDGRQSRSTTRSPVKRNETFRVERPTLDTVNIQNNPSIRVEIKNSVMPHVPVRMVPVGVAKPMPSTQPNNYFRAQLNSNGNAVPYRSTLTTTAMPVKSLSPQRNPYKSTSSTGRYQTLIKISNDNNAAINLVATTPTLPPASLIKRNRTLSTRIQLGQPNHLTETTKSSNGPYYSYAAPIEMPTDELLRNSNSKTPRLKHTYFGGDVHATTSQRPTRPLVSLSNVGTTNRLGTPITARTIKYQTGYQNTQATVPNSASKLRQQSQSHSPKRSPSTMNVGVTTAPAGYMVRRDQYQPRHHIAPMQKRSRSPIKIPWR